MYSAVLMLALTAGSESVDFGRNRCHGSTVGTGCSTAYAGCSSGHRGGLFANRGHGCTGYTTTRVVSACSSGYGCTRSHGGLFGGGLFHRGCNSGNRCSSGYGCSGGYGCTSGATTCGGGVIIDSKKTMPKGEKVNPPKNEKKVSTAAPATIIVSLPADARLVVDGNVTTSTSERRTLVTPNLEFGSDYVYTMVAEVVRDGRTVSQSQQVMVRGGQTAAVQFSFPTQTAVSR